MTNKPNEWTLTEAAHRVLPNGKPPLLKSAIFTGLERRIETWPPVTWFGDHYVIESERR